MKELTVCEKYILSLEEASEYFRIGVKHLREIIKQDPNANWILWNGNRATIKRKLFEEKIDNTNAI